ncbi:hypothetical protein [Campylobacter canadensis]|uniref:hypothetical protein n=1 Tax=Campylobacter canadensis TaxID=449520 RepID=UPI001CC9687E|nr:hypothetical protein [Campylobacter canadensis]MBZ7998083.1 hypothetical protein [Campylobacter canadensis]
MNHYLQLSFNDEKFKNIKEYFIKDEKEFYKIDICDDKITFLQANCDNCNDINYKEFNYNSPTFKEKSLKIKRSINDDYMLEKINNIYLKSTFLKDENLFIFNEYERLKITSIYGLKSLNYGIKLSTAFRIYLYFLLEQNSLLKARILLDIFAFLLDENIINSLKNKQDSDDLYLIAFDNCNFYLKKDNLFFFTLAKLLRFYILKSYKNKDFIEYCILLCDFIDFFKSHKKIKKIKEKICKISTLKDIKNLSLISKKYYLG